MLAYDEIIFHLFQIHKLFQETDIIADFCIFRMDRKELLTSYYI